MRFIAVLVLACFCTVSSQAQDTAAPEEPQTKVGAFIAKEGTVIVRGFSKIGTVKGSYGTSVTVEAHEAIDAGSGTKVLGIQVEVASGERSRTTYVDYDEIESLIKGLNYIEGLDASVTQMSDFQADYRTADDLEFSTYTYKGDVKFAAKSGRIASVTAFLNISDIAKIKDLLVQAKAELDALQA